MNNNKKEGLLSPNYAALGFKRNTKFLSKSFNKYMRIAHISKTFTNNIDTILKMADQDPTFKEICTNYEDICTWLSEYCTSNSGPSVECDHALELTREIEKEISQRLKDQ